MTSARLILTTAGSRDESSKIASAMVESHLAACVNLVGPIESHYWWNERIENASEYLLLIKTTAELVGRVREKIHELHSYELPEFLVLNIESGDAKYLDWMVGSTRMR